jgi:Tol biopolymer transport system component/DNA-binding winged helix-turn-helix (wHTH) protein
MRNGQPVPLTSKGFELLLALIEGDGREIGKDDLMKRVWPDQIIEDANLTVTMSQLRKALGERANEHRFIVTIPGRGYRFVAELKPAEGFIIERREFAQVVIEREVGIETEIGVDQRLSPAVPTELGPPAIGSVGSSGIRSRFTRKYVLLATIGLVGLALMFGFVKLFNRASSKAPFQSIKLIRLTNSGRVSAVAISPDGKYLAYVEGEKQGNAIWIQQVGTASIVRILSPVRAEFWSLKYSPDGKFIYYDLFSGDKTDPELYRIPSLGGVAARIPNITSTFITFAPDGQHVAYPDSDTAAGENRLMIAGSDGSEPRILTSKPRPSSFETEGRVASWSPDGKRIACLLTKFESDGNYYSLIGVDVANGTDQPLSSKKWYEVQSIEWLHDGSGLLVSARDKPLSNNQVWFVSYPDGIERPLTNDVTEYNWVSLPNEGRAFVALQTTTSSSIFVGDAGGPSSGFRLLQSEVGTLEPVAWSPAGKIVFRSIADGEANLWQMEADGSGRKQLTVNADATDLGLCVSPDGRAILYTSTRTGKTQVWRTDADGSNATQLTNDNEAGYPTCSPDGRTVIYQNGILSNQILSKIPLAGGTSQPITSFAAKWPATSTDGRRIAYFFMSAGKWRIGIVSAEGGPMLQSIDIPISLVERPIYWSPDDRAIHYISTVGNVGNIWSLPLDGSAPRAITNFSDQTVEGFAFSADGKRLAVARSNRLSDVVLVSE